MAAGTQVASLFAKISADASGFKRELGNAKKELNAFDKTSAALGTGLKIAAGVGIAAVGALSVGFSKAVSGAGDLQQQAANISAVFGAMAPPVGEVKGLISELGLNPKLKVSLDEAGAAIEMLAKNGVGWNDIMGGMAEKTVLLANATGSDFGLAADIATDAIAMFRLGVEDMDKVVAGATGVTLQSKFTLEDYAYVLANAGPIASSLGVSLEELNALTAMTAFNFTSGRTAGTSFEYMLSNLNPKTDKAMGLMRELGLVLEDGTNVFFDAKGEIKDLDDVMRILQSTFGKFTPQQQETYASAIFGKEAYGALAAILQVNADEFDAMTGKMTDMAAVQAGAETRTNTFSAAWDMLFDTIGTLTTMIGDKFLPMVTRMTRAFTEFIGSKGERVADWFELLAFNIQRFIDKVIGAWATGDPLAALSESFSKLWTLITTGNFGAGIFGQTEDSPLISFFLKLHEILDTTVAGVIKVKDVLIALGLLLGVTMVRAAAAWIASMWPVAAVFGAIVLAVAAFRLAWETDFGGIQAKTAAVLDWLQARFGPLLDVIRQFGGEALGEIVAWAMGTGNEFSALSAIWDTVKETFRLVWQDIRGVLDLWGAKIKEWAGIAWDWLGRNFPQTADALKQAWEGIKTAWQGLWAVLKPLIDSGIEWFNGLVTAWNTGSGDMSGAIDKAKVIIDLVLSTIVTLVGTAITNIIDTVKLITQLVTGDWAGAWQTAQDIAQRTWDMIKTVFGNAIAAIDVLFGTTLSAWQGDWQTAWTTISGIVSGAMAAIAAFLMPYLQEWGDKIKEWAGIAWAGFAERFPQAADALTKAWQGIRQSFDELWAVIKPGIKAIQDTFAKLSKEWQGNSENMSGAIRIAKTIIDTVFANIVTIVSTAIRNIIDTVKLIIQLVNGDWKGAWQTAKDIAQRTWDMIKTIVQNAIDAIDNIFGTDLRQLAMDMARWGRDMVQGLWNGITEKWNQFTRWWRDRWQDLKNGWQNFWGQHSPSQWFTDMGAGWMEGLAGGIASESGKVISIVDKLNQDVQDGLIKSFKLFEDGSYRILQLSGTITKGVVENGKLIMTGWEAAEKAIKASLGTTLPPGMKKDASGQLYSDQIATNPNLGAPPVAGPSFTMALGAMGSTVNTWLDQFVTQFMAAVTAPGQAQFSYAGSAANAAKVVSASEAVNVSAATVLASLNTLIAEIRARGLGSAFNVNMAPTATGDTAADIRATVEYLQALYA